MAILPKLICRFNIIPIRILADFLCRNWQAAFKIRMALQGIQNGQNNPEKEERSRRTQNFWFLSVIPRPIASVSPWNLLETQILSSRPIPTTGDSDTGSIKLENHHWPGLQTKLMIQDELNLLFQPPHSLDTSFTLTTQKIQRKTKHTDGEDK